MTLDEKRRLLAKYQLLYSTVNQRTFKLFCRQQGKKYWKKLAKNLLKYFNKKILIEKFTNFSSINPRKYTKNEIINAIMNEGYLPWKEKF